MIHPSPLDCNLLNRHILGPLFALSCFQNYCCGPAVSDAHVGAGSPRAKRSGSPRKTAEAIPRIPENTLAPCSRTEHGGSVFSGVRGVPAVLLLGEPLLFAGGESAPPIAAPEECLTEQDCGCDSWPPEKTLAPGAVLAVLAVLGPAQASLPC